MGYEPTPMMRVDVTEDEAAYTVKAEIPGMKKEDIAVSIDGNTVSITAEVKREKEVNEGEKTLRIERYYGSVSRMLTLPLDVNPAKAEASYEAGVLKLMLPKAPGSEVRRLAGSLVPFFPGSLGIAEVCYEGRPRLNERPRFLAQSCATY